MISDWFDLFFHGMTAFQLCILAAAAILVGINKSGIPGLGTLPVVLLVMAFESAPGFSTGIMLLLICSGDIFAISYYRHSADWKIVLRLLPCAMLGIFAGFLTLRYTGTENLRPMIGLIILALAAIHLVRTFCFKHASVPGHWAFSAVVGLTAGFTTQVANAAGPVMALYLLSMKLPKDRYVGTCAWYFMIMNWTKLPIFIYEGRVTHDAVMTVLPMIPFVFGGAVLGVLFVKRAPQLMFEIIVEVIVILSAVKLLWPSSNSASTPDADVPEAVLSVPVSPAASSASGESPASVFAPAS